MEETALPGLRRDLELYRGPTGPEGQPTYNIKDPVKGQFYKFGWAESELIRCYRPGMTATALAESVGLRSTIHPTADEISIFWEHLSRQGLLHVHHGSDKIRESAAKRRLPPLLKVLTSYLYVRIPLLQPDALLGRYLPYVLLLVSRPALLLYFVLSVIGVGGVFVNWDAYFGTFWNFFNLSGALVYAIGLSSVMVIHELAHAFTAKRYKIYVPHMGAALILFWPVLYTDVTDSWKLYRRKQRLAITAAGVCAELFVAGIASFLWLLAPEGAMKSLFFVLSSISWVASILFNLNPAMKFDGYYLAMDLSGIDNLQPRAFAVARWKLRARLLGLHTPNPEPELAPSTHLKLTLYALFCWVYRLFIFTSIALTLYHFVAKAIGIVLLLFQAFFFLGMPILSEVFALWQARDKLRWNLRLGISLTCLALLAAYVTVPMRHTLQVPAITAAANEQIIWTPYPAFIAEHKLDKGSAVKKGELLLTLRSPRLEHDLALTENSLKRVERELHTLAQSPNARGYLPQKRAERDQLLSERERLLSMQAQLKVFAQHDGTVYDTASDLRSGRAVKAHEGLARIAADQPVEITAFFPEAQLGAVDAAQAIFVRQSDLARFPVRFERLDSARRSALTEEQLSAKVRGPLAITSAEDGTLHLVEAHYASHWSSDAQLPVGVTGYLEKTGPKSSLVADFFRYTKSLFWQESAL